MRVLPSTASDGRGSREVEMAEAAFWGFVGASSLIASVAGFCPAVILTSLE